MDNNNNSKMGDKTSENKEELRKILDHVKGAIPKHCDVCGHKYELDEFNLVRQGNQQAVIHIECSSCSNSYLLNIFNPAVGVIGSSRAQFNLDINTPEELMKFASMGAISVDNALDAYNTLVDGDQLIKSLSKSSRTRHPKKTHISR